MSNNHKFLSTLAIAMTACVLFVGAARAANIAPLGTAGNDGYNAVWGDPTNYINDDTWAWDPSNGFHSDGDAPTRLWVTWTQDYFIDEVELWHCEAGAVYIAPDYQIQTLNAGGNPTADGDWTTVVNVSGNTDVNPTYNFAPVTTAGVRLYFTDHGPFTGDNLLRFEEILVEGTPPPQSVLTLQVNTLTGVAAMLGDPIDDIDLNFYEITSAGNSLDPNGWNSIENQDDVGGGFPAANPAGSGNGWEESGAIGTHALAEGFLLGDSTLGAGESVDLGAIYDGGDQDWEFSYRTADGSVEVGVVDFVTSGFDPADLNQDGFVDGLDLGIQLINWGQNVTPDQGELNGAPPVNGLDLGLLLIDWNPKPLSAASVPEPATCTLVLASLCLAMSRRRIAAR
jgi:hypothetical protein